MRKESLFRLLMLLPLCMLAVVGCDKRKEEKVGIERTPSEGATAGHFNVWFPMGSTGSASMGTKANVVLTVDDLLSGELSVEGKGVEAQELLPASIAHRGYYYQVSNEGRFQKLRLEPGELKVVKEFPCPQVKSRLFSHAWIDENTLVLIGSVAEDATKFNWLKIDVEEMTIIGEGELSPHAEPGADYRCCTSGMLAYRKGDGKLLFSYNFQQKGKPMKLDAAKEKREFYFATIAPATMEMENVFTEQRVHREGAAAYGELRNWLSFFDEAGDYYFAVAEYLPNVKSSTPSFHSIFRVKAGEKEIDQSYHALKEFKGKIINMLYLGNQKALCYVTDPATVRPELDLEQSGTWSQTKTPFVSYWTVVDLASETHTRLAGLPEGDANHSQLSALRDGKVYFVINPKEGKSQFYIYDVATGDVQKGATAGEGALIERIDFVKE